MKAARTLNPAAERERQARLRERRKNDGWRRVTVWLTPQEAANLERMGGDAWLGRTMKGLLTDALDAPDKGIAEAVDRDMRRIRIERELVWLWKSDGGWMGKVTPTLNAMQAVLGYGPDDEELRDDLRLLEQIASARFFADFPAVADTAPQEPGQPPETGDAPPAESFALAPESAPAASDGPQTAHDRLMALVDALQAQGLSGADIARQLNDEGHRTPTGAELRGPNLLRDWRKWKGVGG